METWGAVCSRSEDYFNAEIEDGVKFTFNVGRTFVKIKKRS
jgi:hypothetical protein